MTQSVQIIIPTDDRCSSTKHQYWELRTFDSNGNPKTVGGDEFYITYTDDAIATTTTQRLANGMPHTSVAEITDLNNGRYRLEFVSSPLNNNHRMNHHRLIGRGMLSVTFQYTCGIGKLSPPIKTDWTKWQDGGSTVAQFIKKDVPIPPMKPFQIPLERFDLSRYSWILPIGDSTMDHFGIPLNVSMPKMNSPLNVKTLPKWKKVLQEWSFYTTKLLSSKEESTSTNSKGVIVVGSAVWDVIAADNVTDWIGTHAQAMTELLQHIRQYYPNVDVAVRSPYAMHVHNPILALQNLQKKSNSRRNQKKAQSFARLLHRIRYMSESRTREVYQVQKQICETLQVPFLDGYQASFLSADHMMEGDGRHYTATYNKFVSNWFMATSLVEKMWNDIQQKQENGNTQQGFLIPYACDSLVDVLNSILVSLVTNRKVVWSQSTTSGFCGLLAADERNTIDEISNRDVLKLNHTNHILTRNELKDYASDLKSPYLQQVESLFWEGSEFLNGMILVHILKSTFLKDDNMNRNGDSIEVNKRKEEEFRTTNQLESYDSFVVAVHEYPKSDSIDLRPCFSKLIQSSELERFGLACHVLFSSVENAEDWKTILDQEYNCTALTMSSAVYGVETHSPSNTTSLYNFLDSLDIVATTAYDGYILPKVSSSMIDSQLYLDMIHYNRAKHARKNGILPVKQLPSCSW